MKVKLYNILGILLTIIIIGGILYPWSKENTKEGFIVSDGDRLAFFQFLLETRRHANKYKTKILNLKTQAEKNLKTVNGQDYIKYVSDVKDNINKVGNSFRDGALEIKNKINEETITKLNKDVNTLVDLISTVPVSTPNPMDPSSSIPLTNIGTIKSVNTGIIMNVKHLSPYNLGQDTYNNIVSKNNLNTTFPIIMIYMNNGCLTYIKDGKYFSKYCELTNNTQYFVFKQVSNGIDYANDHLSGDYQIKQKFLNENENPNEFPFNIIYPVDNPNKCIRIDLDGISIEDCKPSNSNINQRWSSTHISNKSCY
jgi:hypothetical protein